jgi:enoyl-CoA hydratase
VEFLTFEKKERIGILRINRPQALNSLNRAVLGEMRSFLAGECIDQGIRALILTGAGEKAFIAGGDIKEMLSMDHVKMMAFCDLGLEVGWLLQNGPFATIAAVNGYALGGGLEMALACDFIYASKTAKLGCPEVTLGLIPGFGGTQRLARAVGERRAKELIMSGKIVDAEEAFRIGLVNKVVEPEKLLEQSIEIAGKITANSFFAVLQAKRAINFGYNLSLKEALELEKNMCAASFATHDRTEGMAAFVEKRKPDFE